MAATTFAARGQAGIGRRRCVLALGLLCGALRAQSPATPVEEERAQAVERAAFLRALSQRVTKSYLMLALGIEPALGARLLDESRTAFERHLSWLQGVSTSADSARRLADVGERWSECRAVLQRPADRAGAQALYRIGDELESAAHRVAIALEAAYASTAIRGLLLAGRLRMLSERMAKFWLYRHGGFSAAAAGMELHLARAHFTALLVQVERLDLAPPAVAAAAVLRRHWPAYDALLLAPAPGSPAELLRRSEQTLGHAQDLVQAMLAPRVGAGAPAREASQAGRR